MRVVIQENLQAISRWAANHIANAINSYNQELRSKDRPFVLGLPTGSTPLLVYRNLVAMHKAGQISFRNVVTFNMDEYVGLPQNHPQSYWHYMHENLFDHIDILPQNINIPNGLAPDLDLECQAYESKIASLGGIDLFLGGIGVDGHLAFNEPFTSLVSRTGLRTLTPDTRLANSRFFGGDPTQVPAQAISVGIGTIFDARQILILASGPSKARALAHTIQGPISHQWTSSILQMHPDSIILCDEPACDDLTVSAYRYFKSLEQ